MCVGNAFEPCLNTYANLSVLSLRPFVAISIVNIQYNMTYKKNIGSTAKFIHELTEDKVTIPNLPFENKEGQFTFEESFLSFLLYPRDNKEHLTQFITNSTWRDSLEVSTKSGSYKIHQATLSTPKNLFALIDANNKCCIRFCQLMDSRWSKETKYYYRYILPVKHDTWRDFITGTDYYQDCDDTAPINEYPYLGEVIRIDFSEEQQIHLFPIYNEVFESKCLMIESKYLVIESQFLCTYDDMNRYMYAISLSFGLVTTVAPLDYVIVVASKTSDFEGEIMGGIVKLPPTIKNQYRFIATDISELYNDLKKKVDYDAFRPYCDEKGNLLKDRLNPMQEQEFVALARMLYENKALARAALMLIDSSMNLQCLGAISAVALETICSVLIEANKEFLPKHLKKNGKERRRKNEEKLTEPFMLPQIGYELSEEKGKELVDVRNSFLHGGVLGFSYTEYDKLLYPCMKLRCLCGILLFRYAGYKGPILNNAVEMGLEKALANKEPLFITYEEKTEAPQPTEEPEAGV